MKRILKTDTEEAPTFPEINSLNRAIQVGEALAGELVAILDDLQNEILEDPDHPPTSSFYYNRTSIVTAFKDETLYVLTDARLDDEATRKLFIQRGALFNAIGSEASFFPCTIPAFAVMEGDTISMIWVRKDWRRLGYGRVLVEHLRAKHAYALPESIDFWTRLGFRPTGEKRGTLAAMEREISKKD